LSHHIELTAAEEATLAQLERQERSFRRGTVVLREHESARDLFVVREGWLYSCVLLDNGTRQITRLHFPGDVLGLSGLAFGQSSDSIVAVTDVSLCPFDRDRMAALFVEHPRIAGLLFSLAVTDRAAVADRLASVGRTSARARVGALLCEILARLRLTDHWAGDEFAMPLTQEEIGDATGLTAVHVNRMMRALVDDGLIERNGHLIRLRDEARLAHEAGFVNRFARIDTSWLPPAR
jgi:CRP-like cAMP-binding protein